MRILDSERVLDCSSQSATLIPLSLDSPSSDTLCVCIPPYISLNMQIVSNAISRSIYVWPHKPLHLLEEGQKNPFVRFTYLCHISGEESVFLSFLYIKLFELCVNRFLHLASECTCPRRDYRWFLLC